MNKINTIIAYLIAIMQFQKDIHYTAHGEAFYSKHIFVDKFNFDDYIDLLKEVCLLGTKNRPLPSKEYLEMASKLMIKPQTDDDEVNFVELQSLVQKATSEINSLAELSKGEENLTGAIAQDLQQLNGLLNLQIEE